MEDILCYQLWSSSVCFPCVIPAEEFRNTIGRVISLFSVIQFLNIECQDSVGLKVKFREMKYQNVNP
jgi:hypothetical protein